ADDREGILDCRDLRNGEPEEVTPGKGERDTRRVRAAHAQVLGGGPHADVEEAAVVERVRAGRRRALLDGLHAVAEVVAAGGRQGRARVTLGALPAASGEDVEPGLLLRGQGAETCHEAVEGAVVGDERRLVELNGQPEEERAVLLHHRELAGGERGARGGGDGPDAGRGGHDLVR